MFPFLPTQSNEALAQVEDVRVEAKRPKTPPPDPGLFLGDCLEMMTQIPDNSVDCILTDPPYGITYQSEHRTNPFPHMANDTQEEAYALLDKALALGAKKLKDGSHVLIFTSAQSFCWMRQVVEKYFTLKVLLIWEKNNWTPGDLQAAFASQFEMIIHAYKGRRHLLGERRSSNVLHFDRVPENSLIHPAEKPIALFEHLITHATNEGETILDMFMGTGPACKVAKNLNRRYIGIEIEQTYYDLACLRLADLL